MAMVNCFTRPPCLVFRPETPVRTEFKAYMRQNKSNSLRLLPRSSSRPRWSRSDTAATALWLLNVPLPENFWGRPVTSAFRSDGLIPHS